MRDFYVFDIPIYIRPNSRYDDDLRDATTRYIAKVFPSVLNPQLELPHQCQFLENSFRKQFGGPWQFNQVVGWLRLYIEGSVIGGHLWWVDGKRLQTRMRKTFQLITYSNILPTWFRPEDESSKIYSDTLSAIEHLSRRRKYRGRYFDLDPFRRLGPFVDWRALMDSAATRQSDPHRSADK
jgi:hypothetical protein